MKERHPGFDFLDKPTPFQKKKTNWENLVAYTACHCVNCSPKIVDAAAQHIATAPLKESKFITVPILIADLETMHADRRKHNIFHISEARSHHKKT